MTKEQMQKEIELLNRIIEDQQKLIDSLQKIIASQANYPAPVYPMPYTEPENPWGWKLKDGPTFIQCESK